MRIVIVFTCACLVTQSYLTLCDPMDCSPPASSVHKNTGGGFHALVQGIFLIQESNLSLLHLLHCRQTLYH